MRVLIADDSVLSRRLLEGTLRGWGYDVISAGDGTEAWKILSGEVPPALAILDWMMPGYTGPELCRMTRAQAREPYTYILLLTSKGERGDMVEGMDAGADDYVIKPFDKHELKVRLRAGTRIVDLQEQLVATREALRVQATRDNLTQVWNRSSILEILDRELARSERDGTSVGVVVADLDKFKSINDTYGHQAGDAALVQATKRMQSSMRSYDSIGRYGGEEFVIVLPGADEQTAAAQAERMRLAIRETPIALNDRAITVTCSFGCAAGRGGAFHGADLIRTADDGLYRAKREGRDRVASIHAAAPAAPVISATVAVTA